jgi:hypothetical protein
MVQVMNKRKKCIVTTACAPYSLDPSGKDKEYLGTYGIQTVERKLIFSEIHNIMAHKSTSDDR